MLKVILVAAVLSLCLAVSGLASQKILWVKDGTACYEIKTGGAGQTLRYIIQNESLTNPAAIMVLFHGYFPDSDPYKQDPLYISRKWGLDDYCKRHQIVLIMPVTRIELMQAGDESGKGRSERLNEMDDALQPWLSKSERPKIILSGLSSGVENALKYAAVLKSVDLFIAVSGTFDLFALPVDSGEYRIHQKAFGTNEAVWRREDPVRLLESIDIHKFAVFSEEKSIYHQQAESLLNKKPGKSVYADYLKIGLGYTHSWAFWGDERVKTAITGLLMEK